MSEPLVKKVNMTSVNIPKSQKKRIRRLLEGPFQGDYNSIDEFIRETIRLRLLDLGAYEEDLDEDEDDVV